MPTSHLLFKKARLKLYSISAKGKENHLNTFMQFLLICKDPMHRPINLSEKDYHEKNCIEKFFLTEKCFFFVEEKRVVGNKSS
uniref:Uncharacterized protein n=1 Tax=Panagrolaimus sp. JU765 TaxID=591449 RepID=A0AC34QZ61_9BILA